MISYQTEGVKMPDIKKKETTGWIKEERISGWQKARLLRRLPA